jgi:hypothetical protein
MTRHTRTNKPPPLWTLVDYPWSLDYRNINDATLYLTHVKDGIAEVARQVLLTIPTSNIVWLEKTEGDYKLYIHPESDDGKRILQKQKYRNMSLEDVSADMEATRHAVLSPSPRFSSSSLSPNTMTNYERFCMQLWWFLSFIGDYQSMLLLLSEPPVHVPSMDAISIKSFLQHRYLPRQTPLCQDDNPSKPLLDLNGDQILSEGTVKNHAWLNSAFAAFQHLHFLHHQNGSYVPCCPPCLSNFEQGNAAACPHHPTQRYCHGGNPISTHILKRLKKWLEDESHRRNYRVKKRQSLLPSDLVDMHTFVSSTQYDLKHLQMYTMLLDALDTAMRNDGYTSVQFENFENYSDLWKCDHVHGIRHLAQGVKEKHDQDVQIYKIMFKDETPKLCFLRHLLVYVHCTSHAQGHLFPETVNLVDQEIGPLPEFDNNGDTIPTFPVTYESVRYWINNSLSKNCRHGNIGSFGPHTLRRSFYLFWTLAGGLFLSIMKHARHRDLKTAEAYKEDTDVLVADIQGNPQLASIQPAWKWHHRLLANDGQNLRRLQAFDPTDIRLHSLKEASTFFVEKQLGVPPTSAEYRIPGHLLELAYAGKFTQTKDPVQECLLLLQTLPTIYREPLTTQFHRAVNHLANTCAMGTLSTPEDTVIEPSVNHLANPTAAEDSDDGIPGNRDSQEGLVNIAVNFQDSFGSNFPELGGIRPPQPGQHVVLEIDLQEARSKRHPYYKLKRCYTTELRTAYGLRSIKILVRLWHEIKCLSPPSERDDLVCFSKGSSRVRASRHIFPKYMNQFSKCFHICYSQDVESMVLDHPHFSAKAFVGCKQCLSSANRI